MLNWFLNFGMLKIEVWGLGIGASKKTKAFLILIHLLTWLLQLFLGFCS